MDLIKQAFSKIKQEISEINQKIEFQQKQSESLNNSIIETRNSFISLCEIIKKLQDSQQKITNKLNEFHEKQEKIKENNKNTQNLENIETSTLRHINSTPSTHPSTHQQAFKGLKEQNNAISTGNEGASTDKQTDKQTDTSTHNFEENKQEILKNKDSITNAAEILDSLDTLKKEIRLKFKRLTDQEMLVFSTLYQLEEEQGYTDYKSIAIKLNLTESSIRDYIGRLIKKGIPVDKTKINNKSIHLKVSDNLKKVASLPTIFQLREI